MLTILPKRKAILEISGKVTTFYIKIITINLQQTHKIMNQKRFSYFSLQ